MILTSFSGVKLVHFGDNHVTLFSVPYLVPLFATLRGPRDRAEIDIADDGLPEMALLLGCTEVAVVVASLWQHVYSHWAASADRAGWAVGPSWAQPMRQDRDSPHKRKVAKAALFRCLWRWARPEAQGQGQVLCQLAPCWSHKDPCKRTSQLRGMGGAMTRGIRFACGSLSKNSDSSRPNSTLSICQLK